MKKINLILIPCLIASLINFSSCKKTEVSNKKTNTGANASSLMKEYLLDSTVYDYTVLISTVHPISVFEPSDINKSFTGIQAYHQNFSNYGSLLVEGVGIPYTQETYFIETDSILHSSQFTGKNVQCQFTSTNTQMMPSFSIQEYSPQTSNVQYVGLNNHKIDRNSGLTVNWTKDVTFGNKDGILIMEGVVNESTSITAYKEFNEYDETITITSSDLAQFSNCSAVRIYFARGNSTLVTVAGKTVDFQTLNYCWSKLYFN